MLRNSCALPQRLRRAWPFPAGSVQNGYETVDCGGEGAAIIFEVPPDDPVGSTTAMLGGWKGATLATFNATVPGGDSDGFGWQPGDTLGNGMFQGV